MGLSMLVGFEQAGLAIGRKGQHAGLLSLGLVGMHGPDGLCEPGLEKIGLDLGLNWANECFEFGPWLEPDQKRKRSENKIMIVIIKIKYK